MWKEGSIKVGTEIFHYWVESKRGRSKHGIDGGKITKLIIMGTRGIEVNYDRGWDIEPDKKDDEAMLLAYSIILNDYN